MYRSLRQFDQHNINHHTKRSAETRIESWTNTSGLKYGKFFFSLSISTLPQVGQMDDIPAPSDTGEPLEEGGGEGPPLMLA